MNRALVAVSDTDVWLFLAVKGREVETEAREVDPGLEHIEGFRALPFGLSVIDFQLSYRASPPDDCDVTAYDIKERRPTTAELAALSSDGPGALRALWSDILCEQEAP